VALAEDRRRDLDRDVPVAPESAQHVLMVHSRDVGSPGVLKCVSIDLAAE
jgi:hypothetical protein